MSSDSIVKTLSTINAIFNNFISKKNYYLKPYFSHVKLEKRNYQLTANYNGNNFYEWNIDKMSEHQITNLLHKMMKRYHIKLFQN